MSYVCHQNQTQRISAISEALADIQKGNIGEIPDHLRDAHYKGAKELGRGIGYLYPHDYEAGWVHNSIYQIS